MKQLILAIYNNHAKHCGKPPKGTNRTPHKYYGYFENMFGEQWVFVYDYNRKKAVVCGGDAGWEKYEVVDGVAKGLVMDPIELAWLSACWNATHYK